MASISAISGSVAILKIFYLNLEQSIIVGYQFSYLYDFGKSETFKRTGYVNHLISMCMHCSANGARRFPTFSNPTIVVVNQAYYGDHWLFTNIERKATLDIEIFQ
jgi:hypothetical protein